MATELWGIDTTAAQTAEPGLGSPAGDALFSVADSGGAEVVAAFVREGLLTVEFYDEQGLPTAARPRVTLTTAGMTLSEVEAAATGVVGFAVGWADTTGASAAQANLSVQYFGLGGPYGPPVAIGTGHDLELSGFEVLDTQGKKPVADGFSAVWIDNGVVTFQRFSVWLDGTKDPVGTVQPAGLDGIPGTTRPGAIDPKSTAPADGGANLPVTFGAGGAGDVALTTTHDGETVITWSETGATGQVIRLMVLNRNGSANTSIHGIGGAPVTIDLAGVPAAAHVETAWLAGGGFVVAWSEGTQIHARVYAVTGGTPGTSATFAPGPELVLADLGAEPFDGTFSLSTMLESIGGFTLTFSQGSSVMAASFTAAGGPMDAAPLAVATITAGSDVATASLASERVLILSESGGGVQSSIIDPRGALGQVILGADTDRKVIADVLVGTVGDDTIDGGVGDDILDGGMGNDSIVAGSGSDLIDAGGGRDVVSFSGNRADYTVTDLGAGLFEVTDMRGIDGADLIRNAETLRFADADLVIADAGGSGPYVTPTAWGLGDADGDALPSDHRTPDTDGFIVNSDNPGDRTGRQSAPVVSDNVGEFVAILWETETATGSRIRASFYNVLVEPDVDTPLPDNIFLTDGVGVETRPVVASGGAASGWGFVFSEDRTDGTQVLKTNFLGIGLTGTEQAVDDQPGMHFHDASVFGSFLDRRLVDGSIVDARPAAMNDGYNVVYIASAVGGDGSFDPTYGEIRIQRFEVPLSTAGEPGSPVAGGLDGMAGVRDGSVIEAGHDAPHVLATSGRSPSVTALHTFETIAVWIERDASGVEHVAGTAIDDMGGIIPVDMRDISHGDVLSPEAGVSVVSAGAVNAAVVWVAMVDGQPVLRSTMYSSPGGGLDGVGFDLGAPSAPFTLMGLPAGSDLASIRVTGISGEDSNDLIVQWDGIGADGSRNVYARHFAVTLDPATGIALAMRADGDVIQLNQITEGEQGQGSVAGLLGDRFISVWTDHNPAIAEGGTDIVARIFDTRSPGQPITGDLIAAGGVQARRDILVGTVGDDTIRGDIGDADGLVDQLFGGMGNDILIGGPGEKGAAGAPELLDGGEGHDTAVYTGRLSDYTITAIFDPAGGAGFEIGDNRPVGDANGDPAQNDGIDNVFNVETLVFADVTLDVAGDTYAPTKPAAMELWDGTPMAWSLADETARKTIALGTAADEGGIAVTNLQDDAAMVWVTGGTRLMSVRQDITGVPDPLWTTGTGPAGAIEMTDGTYGANAVSEAAVAMAGGLGFVAAWTSTAPDETSSIHLRFGSTATDTPFDPATGIPGYGFAGAEVVVAGSAGGHGAALRGYEIVNADNDTVEIGFHVAFLQGGEIRLARYEIPVNDVDPATGLTIGAASPATFGTGAETEPRLLNADGTRAHDAGGTFVDAGVDAVLTVGTGRDPSLATLHDGQLVIGWIGTDGRMSVRIVDLATDAAADRGDLAGGTTGYDHAGAVSHGFGADVLQGQVVAQQNGSFGVFWTEGAADQTMKAVIFTGAAPSVEITLATGIPPEAVVQVVASGVDPVTGAEDGFVALWQDGGAILGQRFGMTGQQVGTVFTVDAGADHSGLSAAGIDNGLILVGHDSGAIGSGDIGINYLDTRQPGQTTLGPRTGAPRDVAVGTVGNDAMDGRALDDLLHGGLGDDVITTGTGNDAAYGGAGNDTLLGGAGQDVLEGGAGDDLILPGTHGPETPALNRDLNAGLADAGVDAAIIASNIGADLVTGGDGSDTLSFRQEWSAVRIDLDAGLAFRLGADGTGLPQFTDGGHSASWTLTSVIGAVSADVDPAIPATFVFTHDIENIEGSRAGDVLLGDGGDNVISGGGGDDFIDGRGGADTAVFAGAAAEYDVVTQPDGTVAVARSVAISLLQPTGLERVVLADVEYLRFGDRTIRAADIPTTAVGAETLPQAGTDPQAVADIATVNEDGTVTIDVLGNDLTGPGGGTLRVTHVAGTPISQGVPMDIAVGTVTLTAGGQLLFAPAPDLNGPVSLSYTLSDGLGGAATGTVSVTVIPQPDAPTGIADSFTAVAGKALLLDVLANDINPDAPGAGLELLGVELLSGSGSATVEGNVIDFTGAAAGNVMLRYTVGLGSQTSTAEVMVTVEANTNTAPVLTGDFAAPVQEGGTVTLTTADLDATDAEGQPITYAISGLTHGTLLVDGVAADTFQAGDLVSFRHDGSETLSAGFDVVAKDSEGASSASRHFSVSVTPVNDAPVVTGSGAPLTYVENAAALLVAPSLTLSDVDSTGLIGARVTIAATLPEDRLVIGTWRSDSGQPFTSASGRVTGNFVNGSLVLTGIASLAEYQGLLQMVGFANASDRPATETRSITFEVDDGSSQNATGSAVATVQILPQDDAASGWVAITAATGANGTAVLTAASALIDADLGNPAVNPTYLWSSALTLGGAETAIGTGASLSILSLAGPRYITVDASYSDDFGGHAVQGAKVALVGSGGADTLSAADVDWVLGMAGNDRIVLGAGTRADVVIDGGSGTDTVVVTAATPSFAPLTDAQMVRVEAVTAAGLSTAVTIDLSKQTEAFTLTGGSGADILSGGSAADRIDGGGGNDRFVAHVLDGSDTYVGGAGIDTLDIGLTMAGATIDLARGSARSTQIGNDSLTGIENVLGGGGADAISGSTAANLIEGGGGNDTLRGGDGIDTLKGGAGDDWLFGDGGRDVLCGNDGNDVFAFTSTSAGPDMITDFRPGDRIALTQSAFLRGLTTTQIADGSWYWEGPAAHDATDRITYDHTTGYLTYDSNGSGGGGTIVQLARIDDDDDASNGFLASLSFADFLVT